MRKMISKLCILITGALVIPGLLGASLCFGQEMPAVGTTIDKSNYKKYSHLIPPEWNPAFEDGFGGLLPLWKMKVAAAKSYPQPKAYLDYSAKNKGKYSIDAKGNIIPAFNREGIPFPDLQDGDKDFTSKLMWNYDSRYMCDEILSLPDTTSYEKRRGEPVHGNQAGGFYLFFKGRLASAKPDLLPNPLALQRATIFHFYSPESSKNTMMLSYRFIDQNKPDETYMYLPSLRRVMRAEAGQRSTPMLGSTNALDDFGIFDGKTSEFTYTLVRKQKILAVMDSKTSRKTDDEALRKNNKVLPVDVEGYEIRDVYVIDIKPKNPKYPQGLKRIYVDVENNWPLYGFAYDRAGKLWKVWSMSLHVLPLPAGQKYVYQQGLVCVDIQFGMSSQFSQASIYNDDKLSYSDCTPSALLKRAR